MVEWGEGPLRVESGLLFEAAGGQKQPSNEKSLLRKFVEILLLAT